jgi:hypothetical protein
MELGVYEHYKGKRYLVLGLARHSETGVTHVVYVPLYEIENSHGIQMAVRPLSMFVETVKVDPMTRQESANGRPTPRFKYLGAR